MRRTSASAAAATSARDAVSVWIVKTACVVPTDTGRARWHQLKLLRFAAISAPDAVDGYCASVRSGPMAICFAQHSDEGPQACRHMTMAGIVEAQAGKRRSPIV